MPYQYLRYVYYTSDTTQSFAPMGMKRPFTLREEATYRAEHMVKVLKFARAQIPGLGPQNPVTGLKNSQILTIFLAPEFVFRSSRGQMDGTGHYSLMDALSARGIIRQAVMHDSDFDDWLVVPGTVIYCQHRANAQQASVIFNEAWAFARGTATDPQVDTTCQKRYFSGIDDLDDTKAAMFAGSALAKLVPFVNHQIIRMGGRNIGLEVCLDHRLEALKNRVMDPPKRTDPNVPLPPTRLDVHLLPACGMETIAASVAARSNGYFFRCNGNTHAMPPYQCFQVVGWPDLVPVAGFSPRLNDLAAHLHTITVKDFPEYLKISDLNEQVGYSDVLPLPE
jgi:hypothetical protein